MVDKLNCQVISLTKEKDDLLDLAMQRGKLIQVTMFICMVFHVFIVK